jgi:hypothetical protein
MVGSGSGLGKTHPGSATLVHHQADACTLIIISFQVTTCFIFAPILTDAFLAGPAVQVGLRLPPLYPERAQSPSHQ